MKIKTLPLLLVSSLLLAAAPLSAGEESLTTATTKFSDPSKPGTFRVGIPWADITVRGADSGDVVVRSSVAEKSRAKRTVNGLRRLDEDVSFELTEKENVVTLVLSGDNAWFNHGASFDITVPKNTALVINTEMGGEISVSNIDGDLDIQSMNGEVTLDAISGSAIVNTMNGEVSAVFSGVPPKPVSITSMNGEIDVRLPADAKANLRMRTHNGSILTDFSEETLTTKSESRSATSEAPTSAAARRKYESEAAREAARAVREAGEVARAVVEEVQREVEATFNDTNEGRAPRAPRPPRPPRPTYHGGFSGKSIVGTLNGGGIDISLTSMNGTIKLRKSK